MEYRYSLEKGSKKDHCPKCHKRTFVRFIDNQTGEYLPIEFGRCDRESKCGYFNAPKGGGNKTLEDNYTPPPPPPVTSYHPIDLVSTYGRDFKQNNFIQFLKSVFSDAEIREIILRYFIGTSNNWEGATVFWQIDGNLKVRHGKVMLYDRSTGKRLKRNNGTAYITSVRSVLKLHDFNLKQCLFGLHQVDLDKKKVAIVESEKTAIMMSAFKPEYIWLATGSKNGFKYEMLKPLKACSIVAFPDKSEFDDWQQVAFDLIESGFRIKVSDFLEKTDYPDGTDLADVYLEAKKSKPPQNKTIQTPSEAIASDMASKNPCILDLIKTFDLTDTNGIPMRINNPRNNNQTDKN